MAAKHMSLKDLPQEVRARGAARSRKHLRSMLSNPFLTADQRALLNEQLRQVDVWEAGNLQHPQAEPEPEQGLLPAPAVAALPPAEARKPQNHSIDLSESMTVTDD